MSSLYLFRHGQAGSRDDYDTLSGVGTQQATLLGRYLAGQRLRFNAFFTGELKRQRETAKRIHAELIASGLDVPEPVADPRWNEFDLDAVYRGIAPQLAADHAEFRAWYEALQKEAADPASTVHRKWTQSDIEVVRAWIDGRYQYEGESWLEFRARVTSAFAMLETFGPGDMVAVSTSATPIGVWMGMAFPLSGRHIMRAAGALYNASITSFRIRDGEPHLFTFNHIPHLDAPELRTFR